MVSVSARAVGLLYPTAHFSRPYPLNFDLKSVAYLQRSIAGEGSVSELQSPSSNQCRRRPPEPPPTFLDGLTHCRQRFGSSSPLVNCRRNSKVVCTDDDVQLNRYVGFEATGSPTTAQGNFLDGLVVGDPHASFSTSSHVHPGLGQCPQRCFPTPEVATPVCDCYSEVFIHPIPTLAKTDS